MQINQLIKPIDEMSDEELRDRIRELRHRRETVRPAAKARVERAVKKQSIKKQTQTEQLLASLSPEQLAALISSLGDSDG